MPFAVIVLVREKLHGQGPCRLQLGLYIQHQAVKCFVGRWLVTPFATSLPVHSKKLHGLFLHHVKRCLPCCERWAGGTQTARNATTMQLPNENALLHFKEYPVGVVVIFKNLKKALLSVNCAPPDGAQYRRRERRNWLLLSFCPNSEDDNKRNPGQVYIL